MKSQSGSSCDSECASGIATRFDPRSLSCHNTQPKRLCGSVAVFFLRPLRRPALARICLVLAFCAAAVTASSAQRFTTLVNFNGTNGASPSSTLIQATDGNFYGTTSGGGANARGTVFKMTPGGTMTTLHSFCPQGNFCPDGEFPSAGLVQATDGNFYGTTFGGGAQGLGTVFKITPSGTLTTLHSFNGTDGNVPLAGLVQGTDGNFYGITYYGGANDGGTVFQITPAGILTTLHSFNGTDGSYPEPVLAQGTDGNFYGTTRQGGGNGNGGTVFKITPAGTLTTLYMFCSQTNCTDGRAPRAELVQGTDGNFYGTTENGGAFPYLGGTVFKITPAGALTTLHSFGGYLWTDPDYPVTGLVQGIDGNFYGTTMGGGPKCAPYGCGTLFQITPAGTLTTLHEFKLTDGANPTGGLVQGTDGNLYGTTSTGGANNDGTIFRQTAGLGVTLSVTTADGTVTSSDGYINCGPVCSVAYNPGTPLTLTATPVQGWVFTGWTGCDSVKGNICSLTINNARTVSASFGFTRLTVTTTGNGTVTSADGKINCGSVCTYLYPSVTTATLTATPAPGWTFSYWTGCDSVNGNVCSVTTYNGQTSTATFTRITYLLTAAESGSGTVTSSDGYINCGSACSSTYYAGTSVMLTATPTPGAALSGWSGCDSTVGNTCTVTMNYGRTVSATFQPAPTADSVTPNPATGTNVTLSLNYSARVGYGYGDLTVVEVLINPILNSKNACYLYYRQTTNNLYLLNDAATKFLGPLTPGTSGTLSNSQCTVNGLGTTVTGTGQTLTLTVSLSATANFMGSKNVYMRATDSKGSRTAWTNRGTWTPAADAAPSADSVAPNPAAGVNVTLALNYSAQNGRGYGDLTMVEALVTTSLTSKGGSLNSKSACYLYYIPATNSLYLLNDAATLSLGPLTPGASGTLSNNQCTLNGLGTTVTGAGPTLTLTVSLRASAYFTGSKNIYMRATDSEGSRSAWTDRGTWTPDIAPTADSVAPNPATGENVTLTLNYSAQNGRGYGDLAFVQVLINSKENGKNACLVYYRQATGSVYLVNDDATLSLGPLKPGTNGTLSNSQCMVNGLGTIVTGAGQTLTFTVSLSAAPGFTGKKIVYMQPTDSEGSKNAWNNRGTWNIP